MNTVQPPINPPVEQTNFGSTPPFFPVEWQVWLASPPTGDRVFDEIHREALFHWMMGEYYPAHESWEQLWRGQHPDSAMRRALQGLIRAAAAGVKASQGHRDGYFHHLKGAHEHLTKAMTLGIVGIWPGPKWAEMTTWLNVVSSGDKNLPI